MAVELWERSEALDQLRGLVRQSAAGGQVALLAGEAGIGKSALCAEFARQSGSAARVLWGACDRLVTPRALGPLFDIARQTGGTLADRLAAGASLPVVFEALIDEVSGPSQRPRPVVVIEDAHWADEATLDLIGFLGRRIGRLPALLVVTYRDDELGASHPLRGTLASLPSAIVRRVPLACLSTACVREQAQRSGLDGELVYRLAGGNPLLVTELLKSGGRAVPANVEDLILDRLRSLPDQARDLAHLVALVPTRADAPIVAGAADQVDACIEAGVLVPAGDGVSYRHELLRAAVEDSLSPARRADLHRRILAILTDVAGVDPGRLVHHARHAGDDEAILRHGQVAAVSAARHGAHREAAAHYQAVTQRAGGLPVARQAEILEAYAVESYLAGRSEEGLAARQAALDLRQALAQPDLIGDDLRWISRLAWWIGRADLARSAGLRAVAVLEQARGSPDDERHPDGQDVRDDHVDRLLAMAYSNLSQLHMLAHEADAAITWGERARALADQLGDVDTSVHATVNVASARLQYGDRTAVAVLERAHVIAADHGLIDHAARALVNLASALKDLGDFAAAAPAADRALSYAAAQDLDGYVQYLNGVQAMIRLARGDWDAAIASAATALDRPARKGVAVVPALVARGRIQTARGHPEALSTLDEAARQAERTGEPQWTSPVAAARSEYFLLNGDAERARDEAYHGLAIALSAGESVQAAELNYRFWRAGGASQTDANAAHPYQMMVRGEWATAAARWQELGGTYPRIEALCGGDADAAVGALRMLDTLGATRAAQQLRAQLRERGLRHVPRSPRPATAGNAAGLTPRQLEVLVLLAEGLSNAEIALRLSLSAKTVDHHISAILGKLGVASRGQAAAAAWRLNLMGGPRR